jgi:hypothetical protein
MTVIVSWTSGSATYSTSSYTPEIKQMHALADVHAAKTTDKLMFLSSANSPANTHSRAKNRVAELLAI